jgi:hypothetical protein
MIAYRGVGETPDTLFRVALFLEKHINFLLDKPKRWS